MASAVPKPFIGSAAAARLRQSRMHKRPGSGWIEPEQLRTRLACARSIPEILETRRRFKDEIELGHLPVAWSRLSRLGRSGIQREWLCDNRELLAPLAEQTRTILENEMPDARANASVAHAVAIAGLHSDEPKWRSLWEAIEYRATEVLDVSEPPDYARLAWAMVEAKHPAEKYLESAVDLLQQSLRAEGGSGRGQAVPKWRNTQPHKPLPLIELALFANAYVRGGLPSAAGSSLMESIARSAASRVAGAKPSTLLLLLRTFTAGTEARVSSAAALPLDPGLARDRLLVAVAQELTHRAHELKPQEVAEVMCVYAEEVGVRSGANDQTGVGVGMVDNGGGESRVHRPPDKDDKQCRGSAGGAASLGEACANLLAALAERAMPQLRRYKAYNLSRLAHVASRSTDGAWRAPLLQMVQAESLGREREFSAESRALLGRALEPGMRGQVEAVPVGGEQRLCGLVGPPREFADAGNRKDCD